LNRLK